MAYVYRNETAYITRYLGSGAVNTVIGFFVIFSAMAVGFAPIVSNIFGYAAGFISGFILSKKFVFRSDGHFVAESIRYLIAFVVAFLFNLLVLYLSLAYFNFHDVIAQIVATASYALLMYLLTRLFVFSAAIRS